jgi:predicted transcriptional regulator of viral defense system
MSYTNFDLLLRDKRVVFDTTDLALVWGYADRGKVSQLAKYYTNEGKLFRLKNGLYSTQAQPNIYAIAQKTLSPSYISFYTALREHGVVFQWHDRVYSAALSRRVVVAAGQTFDFKQLKPDIFFNALGIDQREGYSIASRERAICDTLYLDPEVYFDNVADVNVGVLKKIAALYHKPSMLKSLQVWFPEISSIKQ